MDAHILHIYIYFEEHRVLCLNIHCNKSTAHKFYFVIEIAQVYMSINHQKS